MPEVARGQSSYGHIEVLFDHEDVKVVIGNFCSISFGVKFFGRAHHQVTSASSFPFKTLFHWDCPDDAFDTGDLIIQHDVWIGANVQFIKGVTVGTGAIIGACTIVTRDVPPYAIFCGNPGTVKKFRFPKHIICRLLISKWWEMPLHDLKPYAPFLTGAGRVEEFLNCLDRDRTIAATVTDEAAVSIV